MNNYNMLNKLTINHVYWRCLKDKCQNNCCGPFAGLDASLKSVTNIKHSHIILLPKDVERLIKISRNDLIKKQGTDYFIKTRADGTCFAFSEGSCTIYDNRPTLCRAYPFYIDLFTGLCIHTTCPGLEKGITPVDEIEPYLKAAKAVYNFWLNRI